MFMEAQIHTLIDRGRQEALMRKLRAGTARPQKRSRPAKPLVEPIRKDISGLTPAQKSGLTKQIIEAAEVGDVAEIENALEKGVDVNVNYPDGGWTALVAASFNGHIEVVEFLLKVPNIDVNAKGGGFTALMNASMRGYPKIVELLLKEQNIDVNAKYDGKTALTFATENGNMETVELLKRHGGRKWRKAS